MLYSVAAGIMKLQAMFGIIPLVRGKGERAQQVLSMLQQMRRGLEAEAQLPGREQPAEIGSLLLIDRDVDLVSPMCTELTYEGLIHSIFGIKHGYVDLAPEILGAAATAAPGSATAKREMNNNDPLYRLTRSINFGELGPPNIHPDPDPNPNPHPHPHLNPDPHSDPNPNPDQASSARCSTG